MFKILVLSDIHGRSDMAAAIAARHPDIEFVFIAGDLTNFGNEESLRQVIDALGSDGRKRNIYAVAGNCDTKPVRRLIGLEGLDVEGRVVELPFATLVGAGGGLKSAGITSFERSENELIEALSPRLTEAARKVRDLPLIVLSHTPPYGTNADARGENHVGSKAFARMMGMHKPDVWICGHIHESRSVSKEDGTLVLNPGPCSGGCHAILEIGKGPDGIFLVRAQLFR